MKRAVLAVGALLALVIRTPALAQEPADPVYLLLDKALRIQVTARILGEDQTLVWDMDATYITISGRTVTVPLKGSNIVVLVHITPYKEDENGDLLLVAQGQVWYTPEGSQEVKYLSTLKSIPLRLGEKLLFFPLGTASEPAELSLGEASDRNDSMMIELQVQILPFRTEPERDAEP